MHTTHHAQVRMAQRGINQVLAKGTPAHDKIIMGKKEARLILEALQEEQRLVKRILYKGGVAVVIVGNAFITNYNCQV